MMSEFKGTPGPWRVEKRISNGCERGPDIVAGDAIVAEMFGAPYLGFIETNHNARLIAAAPDLLEALNELVYALTSPSCQFCDVTRREMEPWTKQARAAIARATKGSE